MFNLTGNQGHFSPAAAIKGVPDLMRNVRKDGHPTKVSLHPSKCGQIFDEAFQDL